MTSARVSPVPDFVPVPETTRRRLGRYELLCELASGGMATVYIARSQGVAGFERLVALKLLHPHLASETEFVEMFLDEARLAARIHHPNVVATLDVDMADDGLFLVMDYVEGDHLGGLLANGIRSKRPMPCDIATRVVLDAVLGLSAAHTLTDDSGAPLNIVHRDISPHNIMVGTDGVGRLTDFGVAKAEVRIASTRAGQFKGKLAYMAPEQASEGRSDQRSDVFAIGIVLWESITSRRLFRGANNAETLRRILVDPIPAPSAVDPALACFDACLAKALARDPEARFQSAADFADAIEAAALAGPGLATARAVSAYVRTTVGEKVEGERRRIRAAVTAMPNVPVSGARIPLPAYSTSGQGLPALAESTSQPSIPTQVTRPAIALPATSSRIVALPPMPGEPSGATPLVVVEPSSAKVHVILIAALFIVAVAAGVAGYFASGATSAPRVVTVPAAVPVASAPTPAPSATAGTATASAAVPPATVGTPLAATQPTVATESGSTSHNGRPRRNPPPGSGMRESPQVGPASGPTGTPNPGTTLGPPAVGGSASGGSSSGGSADDALNVRNPYRE